MTEQAEHLSIRQIEQYRARTLSPDEFVKVARHLVVCDACHQHMLALMPLPAQLSPLTLDVTADEAAPLHLNYDEHLAPYVDNTINDIDREIVESHVELCASCAAQLRELFALKEELARTSEPARGPARPVSATHATPPPSRSRSSGNSRRNPPARHWSAQAIALVCALVLLVVAAALLWRALHGSSLPNDNHAPASVARTNDSVQPVVAPTDNTTQANNNAPAPNDNAMRADIHTPQPHAQRADAARQAGPRSAPAHDAASEIVVTLNDGTRTLTLDREHRLGGASDLPPAYRQLLTRSLLAGQLETPPELAALTDRAGRLRGSVDTQGEFALLHPRGTMTRTGQPVLRWQPLAGATGYTVKIYDAGLNMVAVSPPLTQTEWSPPAPLTPGATYSWQVTATKDGTTILAPQAQASRALFRVLSPARLEELRRAERVAGESRLLRGLVYAKFGLLDEAERELQQLRAANPNSAMAQGLLQKLKAKRGSQQQ